MPIEVAKPNLRLHQTDHTMKKLDLLRLRKTAGLSQRELALKLGVQPSFLSAIENGKSRLPDEKIQMLKEIVELDSLEDFMLDEDENRAIPPHTHALDESDSLTRLLHHIHKLAHESEDSSRERESELEARIEYMTQRNDRLSDRLDQLRDTVDALREENFRLRELLRSNGIDF